MVKCGVFDYVQAPVIETISIQISDLNYNVNYLAQFVVDVGIKAKSEPIETNFGNLYKAIIESTTNINCFHAYNNQNRTAYYAICLTYKNTKYLSNRLNKGYGCGAMGDNCSLTR